MKLTDLVPTGAKIPFNPVNSWDNYKTPYKANIAEGSYISEILHIDATPLEDEDSEYKYLDVYHLLIDSDGNATVLRFRIYSGRDLTAWAKTMAGYGFEGELSELIGVREIIEIKHGARYAYISTRKLLPHIEEEVTEEQVCSTNSIVNKDFSASHRGISNKSLLNDDDDIDDSDDSIEDC